MIRLFNVESDDAGRVLMNAASGREVFVRRYQQVDSQAVEALAERLLIGMAAWRDRDACLRAIRDWVAASVSRDADCGALFVAEQPRDRVVGFISVESSKHFSGQCEASIGELVVDERCEGIGIGRLLVSAAERWAIEHGFDVITLVTGAANHEARRFYDRLGYREEEVRLTKILDR